MLQPKENALSQETSISPKNDRYRHTSKESQRSHGIEDYNRWKNVVEPSQPASPKRDFREPPGYATMIVEVIQQARNVEIAKMDLACKPDFNLMDAFSIFDTSRTGSVSKVDFH